jgi:hypothetical protein
MKRNMNLIRHILTYIEDQPAGEPIQTMMVPEDIDSPTLGEHIELLIDQGLIEGDVLDVSTPIFMIHRLTWDGHDFIQAIKNDSVWNKIMNKTKELGGSMTLEIAKELGKKYLLELATT